MKSRRPGKVNGGTRWKMPKTIKKMNRAVGKMKPTMALPAVGNR
jgi:hypothetical protein